jgi:hypothetical protein
VPELTELLDRERDELVNRDGAAFLRRLPMFVLFVTNRRELEPILARFEQDTGRALNDFVEQERLIIEEAVGVRDRLLAATQDIDGFDDHAMQPPDFASQEYWRYEFSFAHFDALADRDVSFGYPTLPTEAVERQPVDNMLNILRGKVRTAQYGEGSYVEGQRENRRPDLDPIWDELHNLLERHVHALAEFQNASETLPGVALARLAHFAEQLIPEPDIVEPGAEAEPQQLLQRADRMLRHVWSALYTMQKALRNEHLDESEQRRLTNAIDALKEQARVLAHELVQALALEQRRREAQWWRKIAHSFGAALGNALVQIVVAALIGLVGGYLLGHGTASKTDTTVTITTTTP